jgi:hypothetical protein
VKEARCAIRHTDAESMMRRLGEPDQPDHIALILGRLDEPAKLD